MWGSTTRSWEGVNLNSRVLLVVACDMLWTRVEWLYICCGHSDYSVYIGRGWC